MFTKKLLSIVALLFVGSQISTVSALCEPSYSDGYSCTGCEEGEKGYYFVSSENTLIEVTGAGACAANNVQVPGYYKTENGATYYKVAHTTFTATVVANKSAGATTKGHIDTDSDGSLVLDDSSNTLAFGGSGTYLFTDVDQVFTSNAANTVAVKSDGKSIILDSALTAGNYCTTTASLIVDTKSAFCDGTSCAAYYTCDASQVCTKEELVLSCKRDTICKYNGSFSECHDGDFVVVKNDDTDLETTTTAVNGKLFKCDGPTSCTLINESEFLPGYYKNAGSETLQYIKCSDRNSCSPVQVTVGSCGSGNIGELVLIDNGGNKVNICLDNGVALELETITSEVKHFANMEVTANSPLTTTAGKYAVMKMENGHAQLVKESNLVTTPPKRYQYTEATKYKVYETRHNDICNVNNFILEFKLDSCSEDDVAYYTKAANAHQWL